MAFAFWIAITCSCRLLIRLRYCGHAHDSQLDLSIDKTLVAIHSDGAPDFQQRDKPTSDQIHTTFSGYASVGALVSSQIPPGGYITMVVMEDLDPISGTAIRGTIAMVEIEDVATDDTDFNHDIQRVPTATIFPTATTPMTPASKISTNKLQQMIVIPAALDVDLTASTDAPDTMEKIQTTPLKLNTLACRRVTTTAFPVIGTRSGCTTKVSEVEKAAGMGPFVSNFTNSSTATFEAQDRCVHLQLTRSKVLSIKEEDPALARTIKPLPECIKVAMAVPNKTETIAALATQTATPQLLRSELKSVNSVPQRRIPAGASARIGRHGRLEIAHTSMPRVEVEHPQQKLTVRERIRRYETNTAHRSSGVSRTSAMDSSAVATFMRQLRGRILLRGRTAQSRTNSSLENALDVLRNVDFTAMVSASATIQKLTSGSQECCARCIEVPTSLLIHNVLVRMSHESSDPLVLHNLLLTLGNIAKYRRWKQRTDQPVTRFDCSSARRRLDSRWIEMLGEVLLVLSDDLQAGQQKNWSLFTTAADALWELVMLDTGRPVDESWTGTQQRLVYLRARLLVRMDLVMNENSSPSGELLVRYLTHATAILALISSLMRR